MKKWVMTAGVVGLVVSASVAQSVTSENIVGYNKARISMGLQIMATHFNTGANVPEGVFGSVLPVGTKIYTFNNGYNVAEYIEDFLGNTSWDAQLNLGQGVAYWVYNPEAAVDVIVSGEVNLASSVTNSIVQGLQLVSYPYPVSRTVNQLGFTPSLGDKIYKYSGGYQVAEYVEDFLGNQSWDADFTIGVGEGFWYSAEAAGQWVADRPFAP